MLSSQTRYSATAALARSAAAPQAALLGSGQDSLAGRHDLVEQGRDLAGGLDLDRLPQADLGHDRPAARGGQEAWGRLHPAGHRVEALGERGEVAGEQREERVADPVEGGRTTLPDALDLEVEQVPPEVVELEVPLEKRLGRQPSRVDSLDGGEVGPVRRDLAEDGIALAVGQAVILGVDPDERGEVRVVPDDPPEAPLDQVVEPIVEWTAIGGGTRAGERESVECRSGHVGPPRATGPATGRQCVPGAAGVVSRNTALTAARMVWMSLASMPWWVTART